MSSRYQLHDCIGRLQSTLAKTERRLPLDQPLQSGDLYTEAIDVITELETRLRERANKAGAVIKPPDSQ